MNIARVARSRAFIPPADELIPRHQWDDSWSLAWRYDPALVAAAGDTTHDATNVLNGYPSRLFTVPAGASHAVRFTVSMDLTNADVLDFLVSINDPAYLSSFKFEFSSDDLTNTHNEWIHAPLRKAWVRGTQRVRISMGSNVTGTPDMSSIVLMRVTVAARADAADDLIVRIGEIEQATMSRAAVVMDFDDATTPQYEQAFPIMELYGLKGTLGVITSFVGEPGYMTWAQIREMSDAGWAIVSHSHNHLPYASMEAAAAEADLILSSEIMRDEGFEFGSRVLVCPFGSFSVDLLRLATNPYRVIRWGGQTEGTTFVLPFPQSNGLYQGHRSPLNTDALATLTGYIDDAIALPGMVTFAWHKVLATASETYSTSVADFTAACAYVRDRIDAGVLRNVTRHELLLGGDTLTRVGENRWLASRGGKPAVVDLSQP